MVEREMESPISMPWRPVRRRHRFDRIRGQVQKHLLELYAIPVHG